MAKKQAGKQPAKQAAKQPAKLPTIKRQRYEDTLKVILTTAEIADRADRAAQTIAARDGAEEEMKAQQKHAKGNIDKMDAEIRHLSNEVRTRSTYRKVECERQYHYGDGRVAEIRLDTGELINDRRMTEAERQRELFDEAPPEPADAGEPGDGEGEGEGED
jgi:hypothetical protein